jgi:uncharacterized phage infection (PIP) family protein YhgE
MMSGGWNIMNRLNVPTVLIPIAIIVGCVPSNIHRNTVAELEETRKTSAQIKAACDDFKKKAEAEIEVLQQDKAKISKDLKAALTEARDKIKDLESKLATEQVKVATLREEKQKLMSGTTTAQEEIARIQKRVGELETAAARVDDLEGRVQERDHEIAKLRQTLVDRESLISKVAALTQERIQLTAELQKRQETIDAYRAQPETKECVPASSPQKILR